MNIIHGPVSTVGKVTVGLASCVTDSVVYPTAGSMAYGREMSIPLTLTYIQAPSVRFDVD